MSTVTVDGGREGGGASRWAGAAFVAAGLHAGVRWWLIRRAFAPPLPPEGVAGVTTDPEPVAVPAPPPELGGRLGLAVPVNFH